MKRTAISWTLFALICVATGGTLIAQKQDDLETRIEGLLLRVHGFETSALEALAPRPALREALLRMVAKHRNAVPDTDKSLDIILLNGAVFALGQLKEQQALQTLSNLLADRNLDDNTRYRAAQALGKINADQSQDVLMRSLDPENPDEIGVRRAAIEALGKSRDTGVIASLQRYVAQPKKVLT